MKCCDIHPTEPWMMVSLFNGSLHLWNYDTQQMVKSFEVGDVPVRCAIFVPRKNWIVAGAVSYKVKNHLAHQFDHSLSWNKKSQLI